MTPDRVAEALAALEAAEKEATPAGWATGKPQCAVVVVPDERFNQFTVLTGRGGADAEFIAKFRNAAPALLKLARDYHHLEWDSPLLDELADAVLGPEPGQ